MVQISSKFSLEQVQGVSPGNGRCVVPPTVRGYGVGVCDVAHMLGGGIAVEGCTCPGEYYWDLEFVFC